MDKTSRVILDNGYSVRHAFEGAGGFESISNSHFRVTLAVCMFPGKLFVDGFRFMIIGKIISLLMTS